MDPRLEQIDRQWRELSAQAGRLGQVTAQLEELDRQRAERQARVEETARIYRREQADVDKLEAGGLRAFLLGLAGDKEERLSRERREAVAAKCQYDQAAADLEYLDRKARDLVAEKERLRDAQRRLEALSREKAELLKALGGEAGRALMDLDEKQADLEHQLKEVDEALSAGGRAEIYLGEVLNSLDSAGDWGVWDMLGGGLISTMAKHEHMDDARAGLPRAQRALSDFRTELADVGELHLPALEVGSFATVADYVFDGLFVDLYVQSGIRRTQEGVSEVHVKVLAALRQLRQTKAELEGELEGVGARRADLLAAGPLGLEN